jgi:hypothetical protein
VGYNNLLVTSTEPKINDKLVAPYPDKIKITYSVSITPGPGKITIYEKGESNVIKQTFPGNSKYCKVEDDRVTISCDVIKSTFSHPNTTYTVVVDSNFVRNSFLNEPLAGIRDNFWTIRTNECKSQF